LRTTGHCTIARTHGSRDVERGLLPWTSAVPTQPVAEPLDPAPCPIRLVWGAEDRLLPVRGYSERWRRMLPGADWLELPAAGHVPMFDAPCAVAESILQVTVGDVDLDAMAWYAETQRLVG
jgi:pimeloyl-ACP methyl ester carboxylesterase